MRMGHRKQIIWNSILPLLIWGVIVLVALSYPVPQEPDELPPEAWSYYQGHPPMIQYLAKNRDMLLVALFFCSLGIGMILWVAGYR